MGNVATKQALNAVAQALNDKIEKLESTLSFIYESPVTDFPYKVSEEDALKIERVALLKVGQDYYPRLNTLSTSVKDLISNAGLLQEEYEVVRIFGVYVYDNSFEEINTCQLVCLVSAGNDSWLVNYDT